MTPEEYIAYQRWIQQQRADQAAGMRQQDEGNPSMPAFQNPYAQSMWGGVPGGASMTTGEYMSAIGAPEAAGVDWAALSGGGQGGGGMAAAGPYAALAAAIIGNEAHAQKSDRRAGDLTSNDYWKEIGSGAVGLRDGEYVADKLGFEMGKDLSQWGRRMANKLQPWEWF